GEVTLANVGDIARAAGLIPRDATKPSKSPPRVKGVETASLAMTAADITAVFPASRLEEAPLVTQPEPGVERRLFRNQAILHGPFGYSTLVAGYGSPDDASQALADLTAGANADRLDLPQVGDESVALQMLDLGDTMAHATLIVWRRDRWLLSAGECGFDPFSSTDALVRLAQVLDERSADAGSLPLEQPAQGAPTLAFDDLWSLRPTPIGLSRTSVAGSTADRFTNLK